MAEYKKYDSQSKFTIQNARLAKDAEVKDGEKGPMVRLTFVNTSRADADSDMWVEATVNDRSADFAAFLKKGDTLGMEGFLVLRRWGDDNEKFALNLRRAEIYPSIELFGQVKERGFTSGAGGAKKPAAAKKFTLTKKPASGKGRPVVNLDDEEDLPAEE